MYMVFIHVGIFAVFLLAGILSAGTKIPAGLKKEEAYRQPFYRMAAMILALCGLRCAGGSGIRKSLMQLNPAGDASVLLKTFEIKRMGGSLMFLFAGNLIAFLICISALSKDPVRGENGIERNEYGEGERDLQLDIYVDGEPFMEKEELSVGELEYTDEEAALFYEELKGELERGILGENTSLDHVCYDLNLPSFVEGYPFSIEWELKDYSVMDSEGKLKSDRLSEDGSLQVLTAKLSYRELYFEHSFNAVLYPPPQSGEESLQEKIRSKIESFEEATKSEKMSILPLEVDGHRISYRPHEGNDSLLLMGVTAVMAGMLFKLSDKDIEKEMKKRNTQMMIDYPQIVSKLTLLIGAGMTIKAAFTKLATDYEKSRKGEMRFAYEEMLLTIREISSGISEGDAYVRFGNRCGLQKYVKLGAMLSQNLKRGSTGLLDILEDEERDAFEERKSLARRLGEEAGTKLLAPMGIMLVIVMVIVVVPAFIGFSI